MLGIAVLLGLVVSAEPVKPEVTLGEAVEIKVTVKNDGKEAESLPAIVLDGRSVTLTVGEGAKQFVYTRKLDEAPKSESLAPGASATGTISYTPTTAGPMPIEVNFAQKGSADTKVTVKPTADGSTELGVQMVTTKGEMFIRFFPEVAPNHVAHFAERVRSGFYDGTQFHRVIKNFMAQGGDPGSKADPTHAGSGGPGYSIPQEFTRKPEYTHSFGRLSTARTQDPNSGGSQFFLCFDQAKFLDGQYTVLGEVYEGQPVLRAIEAIGADRDPAKPKEFVKITKAALVPVKKG